MTNASDTPTYYKILKIHPAAPLDLITAAYWRLAGELQRRRGTDASSEAALHQLTGAYQTLVNADARASYNRSIALPAQPLAPQLPRRKQASLSWRLLPRRSDASRDGDPGLDYYEILRVDPDADPSIISEAYVILRNHYLRLVHGGSARPELIDFFEEAYAVTSDPDRRSKYDAARGMSAQRRREQCQPEASMAQAVPAPTAVAEPPQLIGYRRDSLLTSVSLVLTLVAAACVGIGLADASLTLSAYGLIPSFHPVFFVGLALLPLASSLLWFSRGRIDRIVLVQLLLLLVALWLSPYLLESTARFRSSYKNFGPVDWLLVTGGYDPNQVIYHNWPLFPTFMAGVVKTTGVSPATLLALFPFLIQIAYLGAFAAILRRYREAGNYWWAGVWFFYIFNWTGQDYFSPQALAFLFYLSLMAVFVHVSMNRQGQFGAPLMVLTLLIYGATVLTHVLTAGLLLPVIAALTFGGQLKQRSLLLTAVVMFAAWQVYGAFSFFEFSSTRIEDSLFDFQSFFSGNVGSRLQGSSAHLLVGRLRMLMTLVAFGLGGICILMRITDPRRSQPAALLRRGLNSSFGAIEQVKTAGGITLNVSQSIKFVILWLVGLAVIAPAYVYGGEMLIRILLFSLPAIALLMADSMSARKPAAIIVVVLALAAPVHMVTHYGNEIYDYVSPGEVAGFEFVSTQLAPANIFGGYPAGAFQNTPQLDWRYGVLPGEATLPSVDGYLHPDRNFWKHKDWPIYVVISRGDGAAASLFYNQQGFQEKVKTAIAGLCNFQPSFDNGDFTVYRWYETCGSVGGSPTATILLDGFATQW